MKKRIAVLVLIFSLLMSIAVYAVQARASIVPSLTFNLSTAECSVTVVAGGDYIEATLTLWDGDDPIASWEGNGTNYVCIEGTCQVTRRRTYTLEVVGTMGGVPFSDSITRTCG